MAADLKVDSATSAMSDIYQSYSTNLDEYVQKLSPVKSQIGVAFAISGEIVGFDLFDRASTLTKLLPKLVSSYAIASSGEKLTSTIVLFSFRCGQRIGHDQFADAQPPDGQFVNRKRMKMCFTNCHSADCQRAHSQRANRQCAHCQRAGCSRANRGGRHFDGFDDSCFRHNSRPLQSMRLPVLCQSVKD